MTNSYNKQVEINRQATENERTFHHSLTFDNSVVEKIAAISAREVQGILDMKGGFAAGLTNRLGAKDGLTNGVSVEVGEKQAAVYFRIWSKCTCYFQTSSRECEITNLSYDGTRSCRS